eukprot:437798_1
MATKPNKNKFTPLSLHSMSQYHQPDHVDPISNTQDLREHDHVEKSIINSMTYTAVNDCKSSLHLKKSNHMKMMPIESLPLYDDIIVGADDNDFLKSQKHHEQDRIELSSLRNSGYIDCKTSKHDVSDCRIIQIIIDLLNHYAKLQQRCQTPVQIQIYKHMCQQNCDITTLMERWHQCKNNHLRTQEAVDYIRSMMYYNCDNEECEYNRRFMRDRECVIYDGNTEVDIKDIIVMDYLDSIHAFIFHSLLRSHRNQAKMRDTVKILMSESESTEQNEQDEQDDQDIWWNKPSTVEEFNLHQIIYIVENYAFDEIKQDYSDKLIPHRQNIIKHMKANNFNGR